MIKKHAPLRILALAAATMVALPAAAQATPQIPATPADNVVIQAPQEQTKGEGKEVNNYLEAMLNFDDVETAPPGANDWNCKPTKERPRPVLLVHGYASVPYTPWTKISTALKSNGFCVFAPTYGKEKNKSLAGMIPGFNGMDDAWTGAMELRDYVDAVLAKTGAKQVDLVSWSQGGLVVQTYLHFYGGADPQNPAMNKVRNFVSLAGAHHGTDLSGMGNVIVAMHKLGVNEMLDPVVAKLGGLATIGLLPDSEIVRMNTEAGDTVPGVNYTVISTEKDMVVTPIESTWLKQGPGATVNNVRLQDGCSKNKSDHHAIVYDPRAIDYMLQGLGVNIANPRCEATLPFLATGF